MKSIQVALLVLLFCGQSAALNEYGNVTGSLGVIKAFQALRDGNINGLVEALGKRPSPVNESITVQTSQGEIKIRLIHVAALTKSEKMLRLVIAAEARISATDSKGRNAAHYVSFAVPEISALFSFSPLHDSWSSAQMLTILKEDAGLAVNTIDNFGRQPIHYAAEAGSTPSVRVLLDHGVSIDAVDGEGKTPIKIAADNLHYYTVEFLKSQGAMTKVYPSDYADGFKNWGLSFLRDHHVGIAAAVLVLICARYTLQSASARIDQLLTDG